MDRLDFIKKIGRGAIFVGLITITGYSVYKIISGNSSECLEVKQCSECSKKSECTSTSTSLSIKPSKLKNTDKQDEQ